jgi:hypothetical protein
VGAKPALSARDVQRNPPTPDRRRAWQGRSRAVESGGTSLPAPLAVQRVISPRWLDEHWKFDGRRGAAYSPEMAVKKRLEAPAIRHPLAERILERREGKDAELTLERLEAEFADASRYDIVAALKALEKAGGGHFVVGRRGQKARFVWAEKPAAEKKVNVTKMSATRPAAGPAAPVLSEEPAPKGSTRKLLVPVGKRLDRPKLSTRETPEPAARPERTPSRSLQHAFHLRPGVLVSVELPEDVTSIEVERFCSFLKAIPFAGASRG